MEQLELNFDSTRWWGFDHYAKDSASGLAEVFHPICRRCHRYCHSGITIGPDNIHKTRADAKLWFKNITKRLDAMECSHCQNS